MQCPTFSDYVRAIGDKKGKQLLNTTMMHNNSCEHPLGKNNVIYQNKGITPHFYILRSQVTTNLSEPPVWE